MSDRLLRGLLPRHDFRFSLCQCAALCNEGLARHRADWLSGWLLAEALVCASAVSVMLKTTEKLTLRWGYPGPVGTILADANHHGEVRGFVQRLSLLGEVAGLEEALGGNGNISAITSTPDKVLHTGVTQGVFRHLPRDMAHLFSVSYQVETLLVAGLMMPPTQPVRVTSAVGLMVQPMPGADPARMERLREATEGEDFQDWLEAEPRPLEAVQRRLASQTGPWEVLQQSEPRFRCGCTRDKVVTVLRMVDPQELRELMDEQGRAEVNCHFCGEAYHFGRGELRALLDQSQTGTA